MKFEFSGSLLRYVDYERSFESKAGTIGGAFDDLCARYPKIKGILFGADGRLSKAHQIFVNGERIAHEKLSDPKELMGRSVTDKDTVSVLTLITGG